MGHDWRRIELTRGAVGVSLLLAPRAWLRTGYRTEPDHRAVVVARVLGARHLTQAVLSGVDPSPEVLATGVWTDAAHALTALVMAGADRRRAAAGAVNAAAALVWGAWGHHDLTHGPVPRSSHDRRRDAMARWTLSRLPGGAPLLRRAGARRG
ncbi:hypothetical protein [Nocardioides korecus]